MTWLHTALVTSFENRMLGDQLTVLEDLDLVREGVDFDHPAPGDIGHAVEVAANADHALARDTAFEPEDRAEGSERQRAKMELLLGEGLVDHPMRRGMHPRIGHRREPVAQLLVEIVEIAEGACEEEVLADIAERALDLPFVLAR